jgi:hypothetical protein
MDSTSISKLPVLLSKKLTRLGVNDIYDVLRVASKADLTAGELFQITQYFHKKDQSPSWESIHGRLISGRPIDDLLLPAEVAEALKEAGIVRIEQLIRLDSDTLRRLEIPALAILGISNALNSIGLSLTRTEPQQP